MTTLIDKLAQAEEYQPEFHCSIHPAQCHPAQTRHGILFCHSLLHKSQIILPSSAQSERRATKLVRNHIDIGRFEKYVSGYGTASCTGRRLIHGKRSAICCARS